MCIAFLRVRVRVFVGEVDPIYRFELASFLIKEKCSFRVKTATLLRPTRPGTRCKLRALQKNKKITYVPTTHIITDMSNMCIVQRACTRQL